MSCLSMVIDRMEKVRQQENEDSILNERIEKEFFSCVLRLFVPDVGNEALKSKGLTKYVVSVDDFYNCLLDKIRPYLPTINHYPYKYDIYSSAKQNISSVIPFFSGGWSQKRKDDRNEMDNYRGEIKIKNFIRSFYGENEVRWTGGYSYGSLLSIHFGTVTITLK